MSAALVLTVYILTFAVGFPANVFTLAVLAAKWRRRPSAAALTTAELLLLNLTAADLLLLVFLPFKMAEAAAGMAWPLPAALCPVANFCFYSSMYLSSLFLAALSVQRYLGVAFPLRLQGRRRPGASWRWPRSSGCWPAATAPSSSWPSSPGAAAGGSGRVGDAGRLRFVLPLRLEFFFVLFLAPFSVTVFCLRRLRAGAAGAGRSPGWRVYATLLSGLNAALDPLVFYCSCGAVRQALAGSWAALRRSRSARNGSNAVGIGAGRVKKSLLLLARRQGRRELGPRALDGGNKSGKAPRSRNGSGGIGREGLKNHDDEP
uniref:Free fatty acid receptor 1 n=1 Tax=Geospiza parvula TaxID=87175 RepID=A0A8U8C376_GEOPR